MTNKPTRITNTSKTCIDRIASDRPDLCHTADIFDPDLSDHHLVLCSHKKKEHQRTIKYVKCSSFRYFSPDKFEADNAEEDWSVITELTEVDDAVDLFQSKFSNICNKHAPLKALKLQEDAPPWINTDYSGMVDTREYRCKNYRQCPSDENLVQKLDAIKAANMLKSEPQQSYFAEQIEHCKHDSKITMESN